MCRRHVFVLAATIFATSGSQVPTTGCKNILSTYGPGQFGGQSNVECGKSYLYEAVPDKGAYVSSIDKNDVYVPNTGGQVDETVSTWVLVDHPVTYVHASFYKPNPTDVK